MAAGSEHDFADEFLDTSVDIVALPALSKMRKQELVDELAARGLDVSGTVPVLRARLRGGARRRRVIRSRATGYHIIKNGKAKGRRRAVHARRADPHTRDIIFRTGAHTTARTERRGEAARARHTRARPTRAG